MRKNFFLIFQIGLLLSLIANLSCSSIGEENSVTAINSTKPELSISEQNKLEKLMAQSLSWVNTWGNNLISCPEGDPNQIDIFVHQVYPKYEGQNLTMLQRVESERVVIDLVEIKTHLEFLRLDNLELAPTRVSFFCEPPLQKEGSYERKTYSMPRLKDLSFDSQPQEQEDLLLKIVQAVKKEDCTNYSASEGNKVKVTIPKFSVGDPEIYVLLKGEKNEWSDGTSILWYEFIKNPNGEYDVRLVKNFGLPDETERFVPLVKRYAIKEFDMRCEKD